MKKIGIPESAVSSVLEEFKYFFTLGKDEGKGFETVAITTNYVSAIIECHLSTTGNSKANNPDPNINGNQNVITVHGSPNPAK